MARTVWPASTSAVARWEPTKPEAPVTRTVKGMRDLLGGSTAPGEERQVPPAGGCAGVQGSARGRSGDADPQGARLHLSGEGAALAADVTVHLVVVPLGQSDLDPPALPVVHLVVALPAAGDQPHRQPQPVGEPVR